MTAIECSEEGFWTGAERTVSSPGCLTRLRNLFNVEGLLAASVEKSSNLIERLYQLQIDRMEGRLTAEGLEQAIRKQIAPEYKKLKNDAKKLFVQCMGRRLRDDLTHVKNPFLPSGDWGPKTVALYDDLRILALHVEPEEIASSLYGVGREGEFDFYTLAEPNHA